MELSVLGINHNSAVLDLRERVAFAQEKVVDALQEGCQRTGLDELVILSTCNRTELFFPGGAPETRQSLLQWLAQYHRIPEQEIASGCYYQAGEKALRHSIEVASGLDSMILGESQILGQMKSAVATAEAADTLGPHLRRVFQCVFSVAKKVRTDTNIGENPVSVASAAVVLAGRIFTDLADTSVLLVGAGETIELVSRHLVDNRVAHIVVANRTLERARELAQRCGGEAVLFSDIPQRLVEADLVITSTASQLPILGKGALERALKLRKHRPILMVDIAVPRDIEPEVGKLKDVYLYSIDDLRQIVDDNLRSRQHEAGKAGLIVEQGVADFTQRQRSLRALDSVKDLRARAEALRDIEVERALRALAKGEPPEQVVNTLARGLTNKLIHTPSIELKRASAEDREQTLEAARRLLGLDSDGDS